MTTVCRTDVSAVLTALTERIPIEIGKGNIIRLDDFGSFGVSVQCHPAETAEEFNTHYVKSVNLQFRPSVELKRAMKSLTLVKISEDINKTGE